MEPIFVPRNLSGRTILLAVSGGIAAYKSAELCRLLVSARANVRVILSRSAAKFVGESTFAALSGQPVAQDLFDHYDHGGKTAIGHIALADGADLFLGAPMTANALAKLSLGLADDLLSTVYLACSAPVVLAPAMNVQMWTHPATQEHIERLRQRRGHSVIEPGSGEMACGHIGPGRMAEPPQIVESLGGALADHDLQGLRILVSAGPTFEALDPVRYLGNRSSGRMGFAIALEAQARGAEVILVCGPSDLRRPSGLKAFVEVRDAAQMAQAIGAVANEQDLVVMAAAVADYRPQRSCATKIKKKEWGDSPTLALERTEDILRNLGRGRRGRRPVLVGFAAESGELSAAAADDKRKGKGCDLLVVNDIDRDDAGFRSENNRIAIVRDGAEPQYFPLMPKRECAARILDSARLTAVDRGWSPTRKENEA